MHLLRPPTFALLLAPLALGQLPLANPKPVTVLIEADRDNTLYQSMTGDLSNGEGERLFAGLTNSGFLRRALMHFDVSRIPAGSTITNVRLDMRVSKVPFLPPATNFQLHRVLADWGEGASNAIGEEGTGDQSQEDDATWLHTFFPDQFWTAQGGDYDPNPSGQKTYGGGTGPIHWSSGGMVADVQSWVDAPANNFGWLMRAKDEGVPRNAKRFNSRELVNPNGRPILTVEFYAPPAPAGAPGVPAASTWGVLALAVALCAAAALVLGRRPDAYPAG